MTPNAEIIHRCFRGSAELSKLLRVLALVLELIAALIATLGVWGWLQTRSGWMPLYTLGLAGIAIILRSLASSIRSYAIKCHRISRRAFATDSDITVASLSDLEERAPPFSAALAKYLPAETLADYYEPTLPIGDDRLRELYAHSAFYTARLLKNYAYITGLFSMAVFLVGFTFLYSLAMDTGSPKTTRESVIATICSFVFLLIFARSLQLCVACARAVNSIRNFENALFEKPTSKRLTELIESYEIDRASTPDVPTFLYWMRRNFLQERWHKKRDALKEGD